MLHRWSGAFVKRVIDRSHTRVPEHAHDWPVVSIFVIGSYLNETEIGEARIAGPSVVFYQAGAAHRNTIAADGFDQLEIEFDAAWLGRSFLPAMPVQRWIGGDCRAVQQCLLRACGPDASELRLRAALRRFLGLAQDRPAGAAPRWIGTVVRRLKNDTTLRVRDLARGVDRHPSWVGSAYRRVTGEGLQETAARFRVERAANLLRETEQSYARVAAEAGFCDQSHMNRTFRRVLARSPTEVREDRLRFRQLSTSGLAPHQSYPNDCLATDAAVTEAIEQCTCGVQRLRGRDAGRDRTRRQETRDLGEALTRRKRILE
jgi:AraC family transcriptional regulator